MPWDFQVGILLSAEEDNLSPLDSNIACLCQSIEINNNNMYNARARCQSQTYAGTSAGDTATRAETVHSSTMQNTQWISPQGPRTENKQTDPTGRRPAKTQATEMKNGQYPQTNQKEKEKGVEKVKKTWSTNYWQL